MTSISAPLTSAASRWTRFALGFGLTGFVVRRVLWGLLTLLLVSIVIFAATEALPGDAARAILGRDATPEALAALRQQLHLGGSVTHDYLQWLSRFLHGDLGVSLASREPVSTFLGHRVENSAFLMLLSATIGFPLAIALGALSATRRDGAFDHVSSLIMFVLAWLPEFVVGIVLVALFGTTVFKVLPPVSVFPPQDQPWNHLEELVLPTATLVIAVVPYTARMMRASLVEVLESDYVEMARLKGVPERRVVWRHAVPNAIAPTIQVVALNLAYLIGGAVVVETVFGYAGIGSALVQAVQNRDVPVIQAITLLVAGVYVALNIFADIAALLVSPRSRTSLR
jgi:peptide/nickel transport system permease protein